jgi:hypothetical protein
MASRNKARQGRSLHAEEGGALQGRVVSLEDAHQGRERLYRAAEMQSSAISRCQAEPFHREGLSPARNVRQVATAPYGAASVGRVPITVQL